MATIEVLEAFRVRQRAGVLLVLETTVDLTVGDRLGLVDSEHPPLVIRPVDSVQHVSAGSHRVGLLVGPDPGPDVLRAGSVLTLGSSSSRQQVHGAPEAHAEPM